MSQQDSLIGASRLNQLMKAGKVIELDEALKGISQFKGIFQCRWGFGAEECWGIFDTQAEFTDDCLSISNGCMIFPTPTDSQIDQLCKIYRCSFEAGYFHCDIHIEEDQQNDSTVNLNPKTERIARILIYGFISVSCAILTVVMHIYVWYIATGWDILWGLIGEEIFLIVTLWSFFTAGRAFQGNEGWFSKMHAKYEKKAINYVFIPIVSLIFLCGILRLLMDLAKAAGF